YYVCKQLHADVLLAHSREPSLNCSESCATRAAPSRVNFTHCDSTDLTDKERTGDIADDALLAKLGVFLRPNSCERRFGCSDCWAEGRRSNLRNRGLNRRRIGAGTIR